MALATSSEVSADVLQVNDDRCLLHKVLCRFGKGCKMCIKLAMIAGSKLGRCSA